MTKTQAFFSFPKELSQIALQTTVGGFVVGDGVPLQVYVYSNDGKWYLQEPVAFFPAANSISIWSCDCVFGDEDSSLGEKFLVALVASANRPHSPVDVLEEAPVDTLALIRVL